MTAFDLIIDGRVKCRGSIDASRFTVTNVSDPTITSTAPRHELFPFLQTALRIPTGTNSAGAPDQRSAVRWTPVDGQPHIAEIELRNGKLFSVKRTNSQEVVEPIHPREFWAAVCSL